MKKLRLILLAFVFVTLQIVFISCGKNDGSDKTTNTKDTKEETSSLGENSTSASETEPTVASTESETVPETETAPIEENLIVEGNTYKVKSLDEEIFFILEKGDRVKYSLQKKYGNTYEEWVKASDIGITVDGINYFSKAEIKDVKIEKVSRTYTLFGNQSELTENGISVVFTFSQSGATKDYYLDVRVYDDGIAFRYRLPAASATATRQVAGENTAFVLRSDIKEAWYGVSNRDYEAEIKSYDPKKSSLDKITSPITAVIDDGKGYIAIMEGGLNPSYGGTNLYALGKCSYKISNTWDSGVVAKPYSTKGDITTGWRILNVADNLNELVNNYNVYHIAAAPDPEIYSDTSWIEPGRSAWSWLVSYTSGLSDDKAMYEFTLNAAKLGFEYNIVDDGWPVWSEYQTKLKSLADYSGDLNVKQLLWCAMTAGTVNINRITSLQEAERFFEMLNNCGFSGAKVDFWWSEENLNTTTLQTEILKIAARYKMIINFHGCNKPGGMNITYPNELTREGVRGLENIGGADNTNYVTQAQWITAQLFTRYLSGHADWTPATNTAMQIASIIAIDSPLMVLATDPAKILQNEAVEFIKSIPTVWDRTLVLDGSKIGETAVYAKEKDGVWFLAGIFAKNNTAVKVKLSDFLSDGTYVMELWEDKGGAKVKTEKLVTKNDVLTFVKSAGQGFAARFSKFTLSQYGGEIKLNTPIEFLNIPAGAVVKYTLDGSDPMTSATALTYTAPITLNSSCTLTAAIVSGDGAGTKIKCKFNKIVENRLNYEFTYNDNETVIKLTPTITDSKIYYTLDGSEPTVNSTLYTGPITVTKNCTLKALLVPNDTSLSRRTIVLNVEVRAKIVSIKPDVYLGRDYVQAVAGWDNRIGINQSMNWTTISLGGTNPNNGTKFEKGLSTNAVGYFVYNIPNNAERFVGVVGIDDSVYFNTVDSHKASAVCQIYFDNQLAYTSPKFGRGEYYQIDLEIPEGAKQIKIYFGDAGDGITCDNVSIGDAGFILEK